MEDIGGILFYVIAAIIGIITTVEKKRRKKANQKAQSSVIEEEVFDESLTKVQKNTYQPIPVEYSNDNFWSEETVRGSSNEDTAYELVTDDESEYKIDQTMDGIGVDTIARQYKTEGVSALTESKLIDREDAIKDNEIGSTNIILKDFELRKAIIYSEILNRKYS